MAQGPFFDLKPVYDLTFPNVTIKAHLKEIGTYKASALGLDVAQKNILITAADPMEGSSLITHDAVASVSPSWDGLVGTVTIVGQPQSRLTPVVEALGRVYYSVFTELASSVDDGVDWQDFTRRRFAPDGLKTLTGGPSGTWQEATVRLKFVRESGDEVSDFDPVRAEVVALAGTLQNADQLRSPLHGFFEVRGVTQDGAYERARLER